MNMQKKSVENQRPFDYDAHADDARPNQTLFALTPQGKPSDTPVVIQDRRSKTLHNDNDGVQERRIR